MATLKTKIVLRNDIAENWELHNPQLLAGETGVETDTGYFKIGDGEHNWNDLPYANKFESTPTAAHYEAIAAEGQSDAEAIAAALLAASASAKLDDVAVVKRLINGDKYQHTAYVFNGTDWAAMDGNYNAENVYFDENIMITTAVGNISLSNGSAEIPAAGKNLKQVFEALCTKENFNPTVSNPSIELTIDKTSAEGEVGTTFTAPTATVTAKTFGSFQFGAKDADGKFYAANATSDVVFSSLKVGAAATAAAMTDDNSASISDVAAGSTTKAVSVSGSDGTFTDGAQTQKFSASAAHGGSARKGVSNLGNLVNASGTAQAADFANAGKGIAANAGTMTYNGTKSFTATGYRAWFMGMLDYVPTAEAIDSAFVRDLTNKGKVTTQTIEIKPGAAGAKCVLVAVPSAAGSLTAAVLTSSMNTGILEDYTKNQKTVQVADASEAEGTEAAYTVYWYKPAALGSDEVHELTITKK
jgi:hypothetical protein